MPRNKRQFAEALKKAGSETLVDKNGITLTRAEAMARIAWQLATEGKVEFPCGREIKASIRDWTDAAKWILNHTDGPARQELDVIAHRELDSMNEGQLLEKLGQITAMLPPAAAALLPRPTCINETDDQEDDCDIVDAEVAE